ncbi:AraC-type transcriptional regulator domain protein [Solidesulfovibrio carbinoliphilus subsp. oakridgensis]|uniref:AraC-type transcriptional regulator domain protein n=1 Tax=Solidesulfovibrio carbinoliphilus subsp. oakridgensis TaxID=694327 RepID=G7QC00_9BACT|nr:AraC-type transcriptional regulator domain protein [Solidesulfovibrio carbinoliphilus subsp. oakridgensis]
MKAASPEAPLLALSVNVDRALLGELLLEIGDTGPAEAMASCGAYSTPLTRHLRGAALRLEEAARMRSRGLPGDRQDEGKSLPKDAVPPMAGTG